MKFSPETGYTRSVNSHKRDRLSRKLTAKLFRAMYWVGGLNASIWGAVAYEAASWILLLFFVVMLMAWMAAFAPVSA